MFTIHEHMFTLRESQVCFGLKRHASPSRQLARIGLTRRPVSKPLGEQSSDRGALRCWSDTPTSCSPFSLPIPRLVAGAVSIRGPGMGRGFGLV